MSNKKEKSKILDDSFFFKIITLGDSVVGKTSIINKYDYNAFNEETATTIGINIKVKELYFNK